MKVYEGVIPLRVRFAVDDGDDDPLGSLLAEATNIQHDWNENLPRDEVSGEIEQQEAYEASFAIVVGWDSVKPPVQLRRWEVRLNRWGPDDIEDMVFYSRQEALAAVKALLKEMMEEPGGWRSCPASHAGGCKWRRISRSECDVMGWSEGATDVWGHRRSGDKYHTERISIYQKAN